MATIEIPVVPKQKCSREFDDSYSLHLEGVLSREEFAWAIKMLNETLLRNRPRVGVATFFYVLFTALPWLVYAALIVWAHFFSIWIVIGNVFFQFLVIGFYFRFLRNGRIRLQNAMQERCTALNNHFVGRGVNFVARMMLGFGHHRNAQQARDCIMLEVAARDATKQPQVVHVPQYIVVDQLPAGAVPLDSVPQLYVPQQLQQQQQLYPNAPLPNDFGTAEADGLLLKR